MKKILFFLVLSLISEKVFSTSEIEEDLQDINKKICIENKKLFDEKKTKLIYCLEPYANLYKKLEEELEILFFQRTSAATYYGKKFSHLDNSYENIYNGNEQLENLLRSAIRKVVPRAFPLIVSDKQKLKDLECRKNGDFYYGIISNMKNMYGIFLRANINLEKIYDQRGVDLSNEYFNPMPRKNH